MIRVPFPDPKSLQPFPSAGGVHANISGNVNSVSGANNIGFYPTEAPVASIPVSNTTTETKRSSSGVWLFVLLFLVLCIIALLVFLVKFRRRKNVREPLS